MTPTLSSQQCRFTELIGQLIAWAYANGYELTFGDAYRDPRLAALDAAEGKGIVNTLHSKRLAVDFNLFIGGVYQPLSEKYEPLGIYWKSLHPLCRWGGDFRPKPDGNHFSMEYGGVK